MCAGPQFHTSLLAAPAQDVVLVWVGISRLNRISSAVWSERPNHHSLPCFIGITDRFIHLEKPVESGPSRARLGNFTQPIKGISRLIVVIHIKRNDVRVTPRIAKHTIFPKPRRRVVIDRFRIEETLMLRI